MSVYTFLEHGLRLLETPVYINYIDIVCNMLYVYNKDIHVCQYMKMLKFPIVFPPSSFDVYFFPHYILYVDLCHKKHWVTVHICV